MSFRGGPQDIAESADRKAYKAYPVSSLSECLAASTFAVKQDRLMLNSEEADRDSIEYVIMGYRKAINSIGIANRTTYDVQSSARLKTCIAEYEQRCLKLEQHILSLQSPVSMVSISKPKPISDSFLEERLAYSAAAEVEPFYDFEGTSLKSVDHELMERLEKVSGVLQTLRRTCRGGYINEVYRNGLRL